MARTEKSTLRVGLTGAVGDLGALLIERLSSDPRVEQIHAFDIERPTSERVAFHKLDLTRPDAGTELAELLTEQPVDVFYHLAFLNRPARHASLAHELEVIGSMHVLGAVAEAKVPRLVVPSMTALYGARGQAPAQLREDAPLHGCPQSRYINDKVEVEAQVRAFRERHPEVQVVVLRFAPILGARVNNLVTRYLSKTVVPTLLGFDPPWQAVHEDDAITALHLAADADVTGELNVVGRGVLPLSSLVRQAGAVPLPLPRLVAAAALRAMHAAGAQVAPLPMLDYIHFGWVADGTRAHEALGFEPRFHVRDAAAALRRNV